MTAPSGGDRGGDASSPLSSVLERPDSPGNGERAQPRPLDQIFPPPADASRGPQMQETWAAFCAERGEAVRAAIDASRSPPEIAYAIGETVHNYFRTRGLTLTSFELRRLVIELLAGRQPRTIEAARESSLVTFEREPAADSRWTGDEAAPPAEPLPDAIFRSPPSALVTVSPRPLDEIVAAVRARLGLAPGTQPSRPAALAAIASVVPGEGLTAEERECVSLQALSELCGLGLIDRLWADRSVSAVFVNGPASVWVERDGVVAPAVETFRDQAHLLELVGRLARPTAGSVASFRLRDGSEGTVVFPPAAPDGPMLALRRGEPGLATFDRLVSAGVVNRPIADLLRMATRARLDILVVGPEGAGKTSMLAALLRDAAPTRRVLTLARHRDFRWPLAGKVEFVASTGKGPGASFGALASAALQFRPDLVLVDSVQADDGPALEKLLGRPGCGTVVALAPGMPELPVDLVVRLGRAGDGLFRAVSLEDAAGAQLFVYRDGGFHRGTAVPAFAEALQRAGYVDALRTVLG